MILPDSIATCDDAIEVEEQAAAICTARGDRAGAAMHGDRKAEIRLHKRELARRLGFGCTMNGGCPVRNGEVEYARVQ